MPGGCTRWLKATTGGHQMRKAAGWITASVLVLALGGPALAASAESDLRYAKGLVANQEYEMAATALRKFITDYPNHKGMEDALYLLAASRMQLAGGRKAAAAQLEAFLRRYPKSAHRADALYYLSRARSRLGLFEKAAEAATQYIAAFPKGPRAPELLFWRGEANYKLKRYDEARRDWTKLIGEYPVDPYVPQAHYFTAWSYLDERKTDEAIAHFQVVVRKYASDPALAAKSQLQTAEAYLEAGRYAEAREAFGELARRFPKHEAEAREFGLARCLFGQELFARAAAAFNAFADRYPGSALLSHALYNAGLAALRAGNAQRSVDLLERAADEARPPEAGE